MILYVVLVAIVVAAFVSMLKLRRIADKAWARHNRRTVIVRLVADTRAFEAAMRKAGRAIDDLRASLSAGTHDPVHQRRVAAERARAAELRARARELATAREKGEQDG